MRTLTLALYLLFIPTLVRADTPKPAYPPPTEVKAAFLKLLDRPKVPLDAKVVDTKTEDGLVVEHLTFATQKKADGEMERVPALLVRPAKADGKLPVVLALHGTGGNKDSQKGLLVELAKQGIIGIAIDARYHGDRSGGAKGASAYVDAITRAWHTKDGEPMEHPFYYDTCWDIWRTADYLETRPEVDASRIGIIGFSMGGIETWLAASVDDRYKVAVPAIGVQSFRWSLENDKWQGRAKTIRGAHDAAAKDIGEAEVNAKVCRVLWSKVIPGILDQFDCPSMIRLFANRPLLILNGDEDPNCPIDGAKLAFQSAEETYKGAEAYKGADERLKIMVAKGVGHQVTAEQHKAAVEWFRKWLAK
jgi:dienelactone hydrolase